MSIAADFPFGQSSFPPRQVAPANTFTELRPEYTEQSVVQRFEQQVEQYSNRLTVKGASGALTYQALNQAANRVAHAIIDRSGTSPEPVTVPLEHDSPQIMAILGALKAGKFYVPLDRAQPRARLAEILAESQASLILAEHRTLDAASSLAGDEMLVVQVDHLDPGSPTANIGLSLPPDALACILYTSGSTGRPKG